MKTRLLPWTIIILAAVAASCTSAAVATPVATPGAAAPLTTGAGWKADWDKTVAAAKQEEKLVIYTTYGAGEVAALGKAFYQAYGITLESVAGRGAELREKLFRERRAGLYLADFFMMGASGMVLDLKPAGALDPIKPQLVLPEVLETRNWYGGGHMFLDKGQTYVMSFTYIPQTPAVVNHELVKPGEIQSFADLLQPAWKGKIVLNDPTTTGGGQDWVLMVGKYLGLEYLRNLARQDLIVSRDLRQQTEWVARGKYAILLGRHLPMVTEFMKAGAPLKNLTLSELSWANTSVGNAALMNRPAHPNAAKVFLNWLLTREGQTAFSKTFLLHSTRQDVPTDHLDPLTVRQPGVDYFNSNTEEVLLEIDSAIKQASVVLGITQVK